MSKKINILFTIPNFKTAGSQFVLLAIYNKLDRNKFNSKILVEKFPDCFPNEVAKEDQLFLPLQEKPSLYIKKLSSLLKKNEIDVVHSWDYKSNSLEALACRIAGVKYIYTKKNNAWSKRWFVKSILSHHIAYDNPDMFRRFFDTIWLKNKVTFIPHGVDISVFKPRKVKIDADKFLIGCIGVIGENKNQLFLLKALLKLPKVVNIVLYGKSDAGYIKKITSFIEKHQLQERVTIQGFIENEKIPEILATFDVLALVSKNEGLPVTLLEAMACGVPVLSSDSGGGARYIVGEEQGGFIFTSEEDFISKIKSLLSNPEIKNKLSKKAIQRVQNNFTLQAEVSAYERLYKKLI